MSIINKIAVSQADTVSTLDEKLRMVVYEAHHRHVSTKGDYARKNADYLAMAASMQLITTRLTGNIYSREWRPTSLGLMFLDQEEGNPVAS